MIEIFSIIYQFLIFLLIFSFPFKVKNLETILILKRNRINIIDVHIINIIFFIYICLIASFLNLNLEIFFKTYVSIALLFLRQSITAILEPASSVTNSKICTPVLSGVITLEPLDPIS